MDRSKFSDSAPGVLSPITTQWGADYSFTPDALPPANWRFPEHLWPLVADAKHQIGKIEGLGRNVPNAEILLRPLEDREAIQSSRLEGTYATPRELLLFELDPREPTSQADKRNDFQEVFNYRRALLHANASNLPVSLRLIKETHAILMSGARGRDKSPGEFRKIPVGIGSGGRFIPPPHQQVETCLGELENYCHLANSPFDPLVDCFLVHYQFETIHPFIDGNGRVGRLLLAIMLQQKNELSKPWLYMSEYFEEFRDEYMQRLFDVSAKGDWSGWIEFCLRGTIIQAKQTIHRCERLLQIREKFMQKLAETKGSIRLKQIVDDVFHFPFVRVHDLPAKLKCTYPTAKSDVLKLVAAGILKELKEISPITYYCPEVFGVGYEKLADDSAD